jgi:endonuclease YncB( thermonuclease family)
VVEEKWGSPRLKAAMAGKEYERLIKKDVDAVILKRPTEAGYVFGASILKVIDGDTLILDIDCGFDIKKKTRVRLAKLDSPERETKSGKEAARYVSEQLAKAKKIVIKTEQTDEYGRYIGHIFYSFEDADIGQVYAEGIYLNDELLKKKMAERM